MSATHAQAYVNGPAEIHIGTAPTGTLTFFGWSEAGVRITFDGAFEDVPSDIAGGGRIPFDLQYMGMQAFISADVNVYKETTLYDLLNRVNDGTLDPGEIGSGEVGSLMRLEALDFRLLIYAPYAVTASTAFPDMQHHNFPHATLIDAVDVDVGTKYKRVHMVWRAIPNWNDAGDPYGATLWNAVVTGRTAPTVRP